jgi:hypothetical protein
MPSCIAYPDDAGALNVRDYGAKGDGRTDDTQAILKALAASGEDTGHSPWHDRIVYLPNGTYQVSAPLEKRYADGRYASGMILIGQSREGTVIKLADGTSGYADPDHPKAVIFTTSKHLDGSETSGGKDYRGKGEGNDAYENFVENLTVSVGRGNPGAIGIDYLANNIGAIRHVTVAAEPGSGLTGISLLRKWPGPALLSDVRVNGFATGIDVGNTEYGVTLDGVAIEYARETGLRNDHNVVSTHALSVSSTPKPIVNVSHDGLIVLDEARLQTPATSETELIGPSAEAIVNSGYVNIRNLYVAPSFAARKHPGEPFAHPIDGVFDGVKKLGPSHQSWSLHAETPPPDPAIPVSQWVSVARFGAVPDTGQDETAAIQQAFNSGARALYFPHGLYQISNNITVPQSVQYVAGMMSTIGAYRTRQPGFRRGLGMLHVVNNQHPFTIAHMTFDHSDLGEQVAIDAGGSQPIVLRDIVGAGTITLFRPATSGKAFVEDTCCGEIDVRGPAGVWIRQLNTEGPNNRVRNDGSPLWILGVKSEGDCTILDEKPGSTTEILGGLIYPVTPTNPVIPAFRYAEEAFNPKAVYEQQVEVITDGQTRIVHGTDLPERNKARINPGMALP